MQRSLEAEAHRSRWMRSCRRWLTCQRCRGRATSEPLAICLFAWRRGSVTVGTETTVQEFTMLNGAILGDEVTVGHGAAVDYIEV